MCANAEGNGVMVATADGEVLNVDSNGKTRTLVGGVPCINSLALGA